MYLKEYQERVVGEIRHFLTVANEKRKEEEKNKKEFEKLDKKLREKLAGELNYVKETFKSIGRVYEDDCRDGLKRPYPRVVIKVPTGGGKNAFGGGGHQGASKYFCGQKKGTCGMGGAEGDNIHTNH